MLHNEPDRNGEADVWHDGRQQCFCMSDANPANARSSSTTSDKLCLALSNNKGNSKLLSVSEELDTAANCCMPARTLDY